MVADPNVLTFCQVALGDIGTRSRITSVDPPDGSTEAYYCALFINSTRDEVLRAAHWNFAGRTEPGILWKALPGTPENPTIPTGFRWNVSCPAPPWLYAYNWPADQCIQIRRVREQALPLAGDGWGGVPLYGNISTTTAQYNQQRCAPFEVASDAFDANGTPINLTYSIATIAPATGGAGYAVGDLVYLSIPPPPDATGQPAVVRVTAVDLSQAVTALQIVTGGTFNSNTTFQLYQTSTTGAGQGLIGQVTWGGLGPGNQRVILTNAQNALIDYTTSDVGILLFDPLFQNAFQLAFEAKLALALLGDKEMHKLKLTEANNSILEARIRDGNEGLTSYDHVPDWLQVRGVVAMPPIDWYYPNYGPLFAV